MWTALLAIVVRHCFGLAGYVTLDDGDTICVTAGATEHPYGTPRPEGWAACIAWCDSQNSLSFVSIAHNTRSNECICYSGCGCMQYSDKENTWQMYFPANFTMPDYCGGHHPPQSSAIPLQIADDDTAQGGSGNGGTAADNNVCGDCAVCLATGNWKDDAGNVWPSRCAVEHDPECAKALHMGDVHLTAGLLRACFPNVNMNTKYEQMENKAQMVDWDDTAAECPQEFVDFLGEIGTNANDATFSLRGEMHPLQDGQPQEARIEIGIGHSLWIGFDYRCADNTCKHPGTSTMHARVTYPKALDNWMVWNFNDGLDCAGEWMTQPAGQSEGVGGNDVCGDCAVCRATGNWKDDAGDVWPSRCEGVQDDPECAKELYMGYVHLTAELLRACFPNVNLNAKYEHMENKAQMVDWDDTAAECPQEFVDFLGEIGTNANDATFSLRAEKHPLQDGQPQEARIEIGIGRSLWIGFDYRCADDTCKHPGTGTMHARVTYPKAQRNTMIWRFNNAINCLGDFQGGGDAGEDPTAAFNCDMVLRNGRMSKLGCPEDPTNCVAIKCHEDAWNADGGVCEDMAGLNSWIREVHIAPNAALSTCKTLSYWAIMTTAAPGGGGFIPKALEQPAEQETLIATTIVTGLDFDQINDASNSALKAQLENTMKSKFATANGVQESQVAIAFSRGSVKVEATITALAEQTLTPKVPTGAEITSAVKAIPNIANVKKEGVEIAAGEPDTFKVAAGQMTPVAVQPLAATPAGSGGAVDTTTNVVFGEGSTDADISVPQHALGALFVATAVFAVH